MNERFELYFQYNKLYKPLKSKSKISPRITSFVNASLPRGFYFLTLTVVLRISSSQRFVPLDFFSQFYIVESTMASDTDHPFTLNPYELQRKPHLPQNYPTELSISVEDHELTCHFKCAICMEFLHNTMTSKYCMHRFCKKCINDSLRVSKKECPTCRTKLTSHRDLHPDPQFDRLIETLFPDRNEWQQREEERLIAKYGVDGKKRRGGKKSSMSNLSTTNSSSGGFSSTSLLSSSATSTSSPEVSTSKQSTDLTTDANNNQTSMASPRRKRGRPRGSFKKVHAWIE